MSITEITEEHLRATIAEIGKRDVQYMARHSCEAQALALQQTAEFFGLSTEEFVRRMTEYELSRAVGD